MSITITPAQEAIYDALEAYLTGVLPAGIPVLRPLANRTPVPPPEPGYVEFQALFQDRLSMPVDTNVTGGDTPPTTSTIAQDLEVTLQIDCYGAWSGTWASLISTTFEDAYGFSALAPNCEPLYCNEARLIPLTNEELQYEERWSLTAALMYTPVATVTQQYADELELTMKDVNVIFPN